MLNTSGRFSAQHAGSDSNTQPADLESAALPIELPASRHRASPPIYLFPLDLVQRVLAKTRAVLLHPRLHLLVNTALDTNARAVIQITTLRALEPDVFAITRLLGHWHIPPFAGVPPRRCVRRGNENRRETKAAHKGLPKYYSRILVTTPEPTVRPPSRTAKRRPSVMAMDLPRETIILMLSPGMHISAPTRSRPPVTSVVRK